jgi:hypothetical protein
MLDIHTHIATHTLPIRKVCLTTSEKWGFVKVGSELGLLEFEFVVELLARLDGSILDDSHNKIMTKITVINSHGHT